MTATLQRPDSPRHRPVRLPVGPSRTTGSCGPWPGMSAVVASAIVAMTPVFGVSALAAPIEHDLGVSATGFGLLLSGFFAVPAGGSSVAKRVVARFPVPAVLAVADALAIVAPAGGGCGLDDRAGRRFAARRRR